MKKSLVLFAVAQFFVLSISSISRASFLDMNAVRYEDATGDANTDCSLSYNHCSKATLLIPAGNGATCLVAGSFAQRETAASNPGVVVFSYEYTNVCKQAVRVRLGVNGAWSPKQSTINASAHVVVLVAYDSTSEVPSQIQVELTQPDQQTPEPQPNPQPNPGPPTPNPGQMNPIQKPVLPPESLEKPGQCAPGMGSSNIPGHSVINLERQSVSESIPIVGADFYLNYSSERFRKNAGFDSRYGTLGGWSLSIQHFYDIKNNLIYLGDGRLKTPDYVDYRSEENVYYIYVNQRINPIAFNKYGQILKIWASRKIVWTFQYEGSYLAKVTNNFNQSYTFSKFGIVTPGGQKTELNYDSNGNLNKITNPNNESYNLVAEKNGRLISFQKPSGLKTVIVYDEDGNLLKDQGANNTLTLSSKYIPDKNKMIVEARSSSNKFLGGVQVEGVENRTVVHKNDFGSYSLSYYEPGDFDKTAVAVYADIYKGEFASKKYFDRSAKYDFITNSQFSVKDTNLKVVSESRTESAQSGAKDILYTDNLTLQNDPKKKYKFQSYLLSQDRIWSSPLNRTIKRTGSMFDKAETIQISDLSQIKFSYSSYARLNSIKQGDREQSFQYDKFGNLASSTDTQGRKTNFEYDKANRPVKQTLADGSAIEFSYDLDGNLKSIKPPGKPTHSFTSGIFGLVESYLPPSVQAKVAGATVYTYDQDKLLTKISRPDGKKIELNYAADSFLLNTINTSDGDYKITYAPSKNDKSDLPGEIVAPGGTTLSFNYIWKLPTSIKTSGEVNSSLVFTYNNDFTLGMVSFAGGDGKPVANRITYDLDSSVVSVGDLKMARNNFGAVSSTVLGNINEGIGYNSYGEPISSSFTANKKTIFGVNYTRDKGGRVAGTQVLTGKGKVSSAFEYDPQGRLTKVTDGSQVRSYSYDANGNRLSFVGGAKSYAGTYDDQDRLLSYGNSKFEYSDNGDLQTRSDVNPDTKEVKTTSYTYDVFGNLRKVVLPDGKLIEYVIDGQNRRIGKKINGKVVQAFIYQSQYQIAAEMDGSGKIVKSFVYASKINVPDYVTYSGKQYRIISDQVGTPKMIVDAVTGAIAESFNYDEFGVSQDGKISNIIPFGFAGGLYDADSGLVRFGVRDYSPVIGRWTNKDPIGFTGGQGNLYVYADNNPANLIDPSGRCTWCLGVIVGGAAAGLSAYSSGASGIDILIAAGIGAGSGIVSATINPVNYIGAIATGATLSMAGNLATQFATGKSFNLNSLIVAGISGALGGAAGTAAGNAAFWMTPVIGNSIGVGQAISNSVITGTFVGAGVGLGAETAAQVCQ